MILDLRTIFAVGAVTCIILGLMQVTAYLIGRFERWPLWWGASNTLMGLGVLGTSLRDAVPDFVSITVANSLLLIGCLVLLMGIRSFAGRATRLGVHAATVVFAAIMLTLWIEPEGFAQRVVLMSLLLAACDLAVAREGFRLFRHERLQSGLILISFFAPSGLIFIARAVHALAGQGGTELFPASGTAYQWLAVIGIGIILMRGNILVLLAMERSSNALIFLAQHDPLTGALNRNGLARAMTDLAAKASQKPSPISLLLIDIDHFKRLNDTYGHAAGDQILSLFTATARAQLPQRAVLARQGGDEFAIVLPGQTAAQAVKAADRLRDSFEKELKQDSGTSIRPTLSIGITEGDTADSLDTLLRRADLALYRSKRLGRDTVQVLAAAMAA